MTESAVPRTNPALLWGLVATLVATGWALWWPTDSPPVVGAHEPTRPPTPHPQVSTASPQATSAGALGWLAPAAPAEAIGSAASTPEATGPLSPASRDPFHPASLPAPPPNSAATQQAKAEPPPSPPPPPPPPPQNFRLMGRLLSPEGRWMIFLQDGAQIVQATEGLALPNGYVVEAVTPQAVRLRHPLADQPVSLPVPEDNRP